MTDKTELNSLLEEFIKASNAETEAFSLMEDSKDYLDILGLKIEMSMITQTGDEKKIGSTEAARQRAFTLAKYDNPAYREAREKYKNDAFDYRIAKTLAKVAEYRVKNLINK